MKLMRAKRSVLAGLVTAAALAIPSAASAAPTVTATTVPGPPQDCQAGCIGSARVACTATDALSVRTTVRCWLSHSSYNVLTSTQDLPTAFVSSVQYAPYLGGFSLCVEGIGRYANGTTASSGVHCVPADAGTAVVVA